MKFAEHTTLARENGWKSERALEASLMLRDPASAGMLMAKVRARIEREWIDNCRPYYSVYPGIVASLLKIKLDIPLSTLKWPMADNSPVLIRLPTDYQGVQSVLCGQVDQRWCVTSYTARAVPRDCYMGYLGADSKTVEEDLADINAEMHLDAVESFRLLTALCLLGEDSEFIQPEVLTADEIKFGISKDPKLIEKAKKRGKYGWTIGKVLESSPHIRRPHFAVRWTGKGGEIARVVPVKGSVVKRKLLTDVPTGYLDKQIEQT